METNNFLQLNDAGLVVGMNSNVIFDGENHTSAADIFKPDHYWVNKSHLINAVSFFASKNGWTGVEILSYFINCISWWE